MMISSGFDRANQKRKEHRKTVASKKAEILNNRLKHFIRNLEAENCFTSTEIAVLIDQVLNGVLKRV